MQIYTINEKSVESGYALLELYGPQCYVKPFISDDENKNGNDISKFEKENKGWFYWDLFTGN